MTFNEFTSRFERGFSQLNGDFYAVIDPQGVWVDSADSFELALYWAYKDAGLDQNEHGETVYALLNSKRYSIVHARFLKPLFEAGVIH